MKRVKKVMEYYIMSNPKEIARRIDMKKLFVGIFVMIVLASCSYNPSKLDAPYYTILTPISYKPNSHIPIKQSSISISLIPQDPATSEIWYSVTSSMTVDSQGYSTIAPTTQYSNPITLTIAAPYVSAQSRGAMNPSNITAWDFSGYLQ